MRSVYFEEIGAVVRFEYLDPYKLEGGKRKNLVSKRSSSFSRSGPIAISSLAIEINRSQLTFVHFHERRQHLGYQPRIRLNEPFVIQGLIFV